MSVPKASMQKIGQAFFNLYNQNKPEIDNLFETIKTNLVGITLTADYILRLIPTPKHFEDDRIIDSIDDLYSAAQGDENLAGKVLYIRWYYHMTLFAMGSIAAKKVVDYIRKKTGVGVKIKTSGDNFFFILDDAAGFSIRNAAGGGPFDITYSSFKLYSPIWDDILEACVHAEGGEETLMKLEMPGAFEVLNETYSATYWEDFVPLTEMGKYVKEQFIDKIKQAIANRK